MSISNSAKAESGLVPAGNTVGGEVGTFNADFVIWKERSAVSRSLNGLVDIRSTYTLIPELILEELGIERMRSMRFTLADGSRRELSIGRVETELDGQVESVPVVFGPGPDRILIGAVTLEIFALAADAANQRLIPVGLTL